MEGLRGDGETLGERVPVESTSAIEELEVEGAGCLAVYFAGGGGLHGHFVEIGLSVSRAWDV